jgi:hypothetical protein
MGDALMNLADVSGTVGVVDSANGQTGVFWYYERVGNAVTTGGVETPNTQSKKLYLIDAGAGGDGGLGGTLPFAWTILQTVDLGALATPPGWHRLGITYTAATGAIEARFGAQTFNHTTATDLALSLQIGYRENSQSGATLVPAFLRPPTFDTFP